MLWKPGPNDDLSLPKGVNEGAKASEELKGAFPTIQNEKSS